MIINSSEDLSVPLNTIAVFPLISAEHLEPFDMNYDVFLKPLNMDHKRDWFDTNFYRCLPLSIGNMQGFSISLPFSFEVLWNGGNNPSDLLIEVKEEEIKPYIGKNFIALSSDFGHGILTINLPIQLKTPPGVNLMTIAAPNFPLAGISPMTGVVEADNLRFTFTINLKIDIPNAKIKINKDYPVAAILPIPRYFCDSFELKNANEIFSEDIIKEEQEVVLEHGQKRTIKNQNDLNADGIYYKGMDVRGNKFKDHQLPKKNTKDKI